MPVGDAYVKYLLKSAAIGNPLLSTIDVICLDPDRSVRERYKQFVSLRNFRFCSCQTFDYLNGIRTAYSRREPDASTIVLIGWKQNMIGL